ncbi:radical SAM protein [Trichloromonas sp.]|uniref:radical SAM protein n=1 Tax=Trichloromonas sp. TaxID=3069249 RepID=UPI003D81645C
MKYLSIHVTERCNQRCRFCVVSAPDHRGDESLETIGAFLDANRGQGYQGVNLHGGEPTLHPEFDAIIDRIRSAGFGEITLQTNGCRLGDREFARRLIDRGVKLFIVSLHEGDPVANDRLAGSPGAHRRLSAGIRNVLELGGRVQTNTVLTRASYQRLGEIIECGWRLGVRHFNISNIHPAGYALRNFQEFVPRCREQAPLVREAVERFAPRGAVLTLEGFPYCTLPGLERYHKRQQQRDIRMLFRAWVFDDYEQFMDRTCKMMGEPCLNCGQAPRCGGVYKEYLEFCGWDEFGSQPESAVREVGQ